MKKYGPIPDKETYMEYLNKRAKAKLDKANITSYNVSKISDYAKKEYGEGRLGTRRTHGEKRL
ncbi:MAG: hypothetical protein Q4C18_05320 [Eubacteriales bacterium]|nr:hypothetical protein [Eubacteriales bacterium]